MQIDWKKLGQELGGYIIAALVIGALAWVLGKLFGVEIPAQNREPLMLVIGFLTAKGGTIVDYYFGSSKGSADKTDALAEAAKS